MTVLGWAEREKIVIELYKKGISPKEIARQIKMSLRDVYKIIKKEFGDKEKELTTEHQAIILFRKGKTPPDVAIKLRITLDEACRHFIKYKDSFYLGKFGQDYRFIQGYMKELAIICNVMKNAGMNVKELVDEYNLARDLGEMEERLLYLSRNVQDFEGKKFALEYSVQDLEGKKRALESDIESLESDIEALESKLSLVNSHLTYQQPNVGYNYNYYQNPYPNQQYPTYNQNYYRYW